MRIFVPLPSPHTSYAENAEGNELNMSCLCAVSVPSLCRLPLHIYMPCQKRPFFIPFFHPRTIYTLGHPHLILHILQPLCAKKNIGSYRHICKHNIPIHIHTKTRRRTYTYTYTYTYIYTYTYTSYAHPQTHTHIHTYTSLSLSRSTTF